MSDFSFDSFKWSEDNELGGVLNKESKKIRVSNLRDLVGFKRVSKNLLVRETDQAFWKIDSNKDGSYTIERIIGEDEL
jgi:hypothetical protein